MMLVVLWWADSEITPVLPLLSYFRIDGHPPPEVIFLR